MSKDSENIPDDVGKLLPMFILDEIQHMDALPVSGTVQLLNDPDFGWLEYWPRAFTIDEVRSELKRMAADGLVVRGTWEEFGQYSMNDDPNQTWYGITEKGLQAWKAWEPPNPPAPPEPV